MEQGPVGANAASDETQCTSGPLIRMQQETEDKESSWGKSDPNESTAAKV